MCWQISSLVTTRSGRYAPMPSMPMLLMPVVSAMTAMVNPSQNVPGEYVTRHTTVLTPPLTGK